MLTWKLFHEVFIVTEQSKPYIKKLQAHWWSYQEGKPIGGAIRKAVSSEDALRLGAHGALAGWGHGVPERLLLCRRFIGVGEAEGHLRVGT